MDERKISLKDKIEQITKNDCIYPEDALFLFDKTKSISKGKSPLFVQLKNLIDQFLPDKLQEQFLRCKLWHLKEQYFEIPKCVVCQQNQVKWDKIYHQYKKHCSYKCAANNKHLRQQKQETTKEKYGVNYPSQNENIKNKTKQSWKNKEQEDIKDIIQKRKKTMKESYGVDNPSKSEHFNEKRKDTYLENYGIRNSTHIRRDEEIFNQSEGEKQVCEFLSSCDINFETNTRNIIPPQELDIYIPEHNLAIEYCGLYWHSEQRGKTRNYHKNKWKKCKENNIQLITLFEDEWKQNNKQAKQKLLHLLGVNDQKKVYARKTFITKIDTKTKEQFLDKHHIQGNGPGSVSYGAFFENEIVAVITFIKRKDGVYILNRYATSCRFIGGFTKMLNHFIKNNQWNVIETFADLRWSDGHLYQVSGFEYQYTIPPDHYYSPDSINRYHKFGYRHKFLKNKLKYYDPNLSEKQNCDNNGILRIWDCGKKKYTLTPE